MSLIQQISSRRLAAFAFAAQLVAVPLSAAALEVFNDPSDTGTPAPAAQIGASPTLLNVWLRHGAGATSNPADLCAGTGTGDEVCGWDVLIEATGLVSIDSFSTTADVVHNIENPGTSANTFRANGGNPINPDANPEKIGVLTVSATGAGDLRVTGNLFVTSDLAASAVDASTIGVAGDADSDGFLDADDNCPTTPNADQADNGGVANPGDPGGAIPDGIGDACQCGDISNDGRATGGDGTLIKRACLNLPPFTGPNDTASCQQSSPLFNHDKCDVSPGAPNGCNGLDGTFVSRAAAGLPPGLTQNCLAAN